jgi:restriction system protein
MVEGALAMAIPDFQSLMLPVLRSAARAETSVSACITRLADDLGLSRDERAQLLPSGKQPVFSNRVHWAKFHLAKAGLVEATRRGQFKITPRGLALLDEGPARINLQLLSRFPEFRAFREHVAPGDVEEGAADPSAEPGSATATPEERIEAASEELEAALRTDLLERVVAATPQFFEALVVDLMIAMGYGGSRREAGKRLGRSGDGGLDGLINEDVLGLDSIYLQAKRYAPGNGVGVEKVREFAGALVERGASKGVFVTTSHFASGARNLAERIPQKLILIDGEELSRLLVRYGVGVRAVRTVEPKRLDPDYFVEDESA